MSRKVFGIFAGGSVFGDAETAAFGSSVKYAYNNKGQLSSQTVNGELIEYAYTRRGQLAGKYLGGKLKPDASVEYEYAKNGQIVARTANGVRQTYEYDFKGQLLVVKEGEEYVERYVYDKSGNMTKKTVGGKTTTFTFDDANQLVSSTTDGITTRYEYDAAGRLVREGNRTYTYGYLDKVMSVRDGKNKFTYTYHPDGQLASANYGDSSELFTWDGLALIQRGDEQFINEPHVGGGNPVVSSKGSSYFNDMLGTTVGAKKDGKYSAAALSAFGERLDNVDSTSPAIRSLDEGWFTGKPEVAGLGHAFLMRNYRAGLGKWQTADPLGYPDGWNQHVYCGNGVTRRIDLFGCDWILVDSWNNPLSDGKWDVLSNESVSAQERWDMMVKNGLSCWQKPFERRGVEEFIVGPVLSEYEKRDDYVWLKNTSFSYVYSRVDVLGVIVTTREVKDDPSLQHALAELVGTWGAKIKGPIGEAIGLIYDCKSTIEALEEIQACIDQYGVDTEWTIEFGTITYEKTRQASWGFLYVNE